MGEILVNRYTGQPANARELAADKRRADEILASPYSSPEQLEWALKVPGADIDLMFVGWESCREQAERQRREKAKK